MQKREELPTEPTSDTDPESAAAAKSKRLEELQRQIDDLVAEREHLKGEGTK